MKLLRTLAILLVAQASACSSCSQEEDTCASVARGGACTRDGECVLALCASACCDSPEPCGAPMAFTRKALEGHECLHALGVDPPGVCRRPSDCLCDSCEPVAADARCVNGQCTSVPKGQDGGM